MPKLLNLDLIREPYNWIVVFLMCAFALVFLSLVFPQASNSDH